MYLINRIFIILLLVVSTSDLFSQKQITFTITKIPEYTPKEDTLYLSTSINNWPVKMPNMRFTKRPNGTYFLAITVDEGVNFEYKVNRGSWDNVEGNRVGEYLANRNYVSSAEIHDIQIEIQSWQDMHKDYLPSIDVYIKSIPSNTPKDARLYITGSFNDWAQADPNLELIKQEDGTYHGAIMAGLREFEYKITRGSWETVEARWDGGLKSNRVFKAVPGQKSDINIHISTWEDISSGSYWKMLLFILFSIQAIQLVALIRFFKHCKLLFVLTGMLTVSLILRFGYNNQGFFPIFPHGYLLPACVYSFIAPWMFTWLVNINSANNQKRNYLKQPSFLLPFLSFVILVALINVPFLDLQVITVHEHINTYVLILYSFALILNLFYGFKSIQYVGNRKKEYDDWIIKLIRILQINWYFVVAVLVMMAVLYSFDADVMAISEWTENLFWIGIGLTIMYVEWGVMLGGAKLASSPKNKDTNKAAPDKESWHDLKNQLTELMDTKKIYLNPQLTLADLAKELGTNTYYVSKILNEGIGKNFADFINSYRINAFIEEIESDKESNKNYLSVAFKVGFNSKSVFNRAFKKNTGETPSRYFN